MESGEVCEAGMIARRWLNAFPVESCSCERGFEPRRGSGGWGIAVFGMQGGRRLTVPATVNSKVTRCTTGRSSAPAGGGESGGGGEGKGEGGSGGNGV